MPSYVTQVADGIHHFDDGTVNWYLVEDGGRLALVDAGFPGDWSMVVTALGTLGRRMADIDAVVITHAHVDHLGIAERVRQQAGATVYVHEADERLAADPTTIADSERSPLRYLGHGATRRLFLHATLARAPLAKGIRDLRTFADGDVLENVPGRPRVVHTPGHTDGHSVVLLPDRGVLFAGDAIVTRDPYTGRAGPCVVSAAATKSTAQALASLDRIAELDAELVLTGHGAPWRGTPREAAERARAAGTS